MDYTVRWSPEAVEDLDSIVEYISRDSEFYARSVVRKIFSASVKISDQPTIGRVVPEINNSQIREKFVYSYRLVYRIKGSDITILAIIHGKRLLENISERFQ